jgi:hypothetical protein
MNLISEVLKLVSKLPPEGLELVVKLVRALTSSDDPMRAVKRAAATAASEAASEKIIRESLKRKPRR